MLANERLIDIETKLGAIVQRIVLLEIEDETLRVVLFLKDGTNLRVAEQWEGDTLKRYSYYWLSFQNELIIGWDNAPHHTKLETFPHHRHDGNQRNLQPSKETSLEDVMDYIISNK